MNRNNARESERNPSPQVAPPEDPVWEETLLAVTDLVKTFASKNEQPVRALRGVSLSAESGRVTGLVGADGAGKTTLMRIAAGLLAPTHGSVRVLGLDSTQRTIAVQRRIGYMPQKFGLYQDLTVAENLDLYADLQGVAQPQRKRQVEHLTRMTGLSEFTGRWAGALSGGMKQKLGLACSLIKSPRLLLLDEPTVGVDPVSRIELWRIVFDLVENEGVGVLLSTAYLDEAERCHHVVVLHEGQKLDEGPPDAFKQQVSGRVFLLSPPDGVKPRQIQTDLASREIIVDATIRSGRVRVLVARDADSDALTADLPPSRRPSIERVEPTFEDAFMALITKSSGGRDISPGKPNCGNTPIGKNGDLMVRSDALLKRFGDFEAVKRLSFDVHRGEIFGLLGPNGAGKSTTFRMLCGLLKATGGDIQVAGRDLRRSPARARARLGYMAQQFSLYRQLSVRENLIFYGRAYGLDRTRLGKRLEWAFTEFDLFHWKNHAAGSLPGGYKQRLAMAAALLHEPEILFLDEPTSGVDPLARREFWLRINSFAQQGMTVVVTTHFMEESEYCDRMLIMSRGEKLALGTPEEIRLLARTADNPDPTVEEAFVALATGEVNQ